MDENKSNSLVEQLEPKIINLEEEKKRLEIFIDTSGIGTLEWEVQTGNLVINEKWAEIVGYTLSDLAPVSIQTWKELCHPEDFEKSNKILEQVFNKEIPYYELEARLKHKNGKWIWVLERGKVTSWDANGKPLLMIGSHTDISIIKDIGSELEKSQQMHKKSEFLLQASLNSFNDLIVLSVDQNYCYLYFNIVHKNTMKKLYNVEIEIGKSILDYISNVDDRNDSKKNYDLALSGEYHSTIENIKGEQQRIDFEASYSPIYDDEKEVIGVALFARDITDRIKQEIALKYEKELAQKYLKLAGSIIIVLDKDGNVSLINQKGCDIIGLSEENILGKNWFDNFIPHEIVEDVKNVFNKIFLKNNTMAKHYENILVTSKLEHKLIAWENSVLYNENGEVTGVISSGEDITELRAKGDILNYMSYHDELTGLYNRRFFEEQTKRLDNPRNLPLSIIIGDVNGLKLLNDAFSHIEGDKLLIEISNILKKATRQEDILSRWGGDEFALLLPQTSEKDSNKVYNRIKDLCNKSMYETIKPSISLGCATKVSEDENINDIIKHAEEKMYHEKLQEGKDMRNNLVGALEKRLYEKSNETEMHSKNLVKYSEIFANELEITADGIKVLKQAARLHDIGLVAINTSILTKPGPLDENEWDRVKSHPEVGSRIVQSITELQHISKEILHHHEWYDGTGYPQGLKGNEIPYFSRIISIIDAYDVMTSGRLYKEKVSIKEAIEEIKRCSGTQFDPELVTSFLRAFKG